MGLGREYLEEPEPEEPEHMRDKYHWTTASGETLLISEMETLHIENCVKMIEEQASAKKESLGNLAFYKSFKDELEGRNARK